MKYAFIKIYKPVLGDASFRAFETMEGDRAWCERELPKWLGHTRASVSPSPGDSRRFIRLGVCFFPGTSVAILPGFPDTTHDADVFVEEPAKGGDQGERLDTVTARACAERCEGVGSRDFGANSLHFGRNRTLGAGLGRLGGV